MKPRTPIAVVSMAALFPGAPNLDTFWNNLCTGVSAARQVKGGRWGIEPRFVYQSAPAPDKTYSKRCCLVDGFRFDPSGFPLPESLLQALDPMHQMVLHVGRQAYSGCRMGHIDPDRVDVVLAAIALPTDGSSRITRNIMGKRLEDAAYGRTPGSSNPIRLDRGSALAGRVVGFPATLLAASLGLKGDAFTLDAACASSLYAVKLACDALADGKADAVIAGGISRPDCLYTQIGFSQLRALSPSGQCAPFDADADGLVVGEGTGLLVLKRLADAEADGDVILGVVRGIGLSNDLRGNLLAPAREGQLRAMRSAYREAGWDPMDVDLIECHGAGTPVGDTEELHSLTALWDEAGSDREAGCVIGSVKSHIGHLLTAAGAAGLIKTLLALQRTTLPPTLHFRRPPDGSPLETSPFRVLVQPEPWRPRSQGVPRRAAVSAFGFGGINAHLLLEEHLPVESSVSEVLPVSEVEGGRTAAAGAPEAIAIVGMGVSAAGLENLPAFQDAVFQGKSRLKPPGIHRLRNAAAFLPDGFSLSELPGGFLEEVRIGVGEFRIPPSEIPDLLLQQLLMLRTAAEAFADAGIGREGDKPAVGAVIGIDFDFEATDFHLRWRMPEDVSRWREHPEADSSGKWLQAVKDTCSPPLTATRTLGALGSVVASRVAREFHLGGPSFVVSADAASGLKALEIAVRWLRQSEVDSALVGAVDLAGDLRRLCLTAALSPLSRSGAVRAFDGTADGTLPGEGAVALVLKRASDAAAQGDRIYAVIRGMGASGSGEVAPARPAAEPYARSLRAALHEAGIPPAAVSYAETHGSGVPSMDRMEAEALAEVFSEEGASPEAAIALGASTPVVGHTGACAGLLSLAKAALCLFRQMLPALPYACRPSNAARPSARFHLPKDPQFWLRNRAEGPRVACVGSVTIDGGCVQTVLQEWERNVTDAVVPLPFDRKREYPVEDGGAGLFVVRGETTDELRQRLRQLAAHLDSLSTRKASRGSGAPSMEEAAGSWYRRQPEPGRYRQNVSLMASSPDRLRESIRAAEVAMANGTPTSFEAGTGVCYTPDPIGPESGVAFVYPGSGNHSVGMGRDAAVWLPEFPRSMDRETAHLKSQWFPWRFVPWRRCWKEGWEKQAAAELAEDPLALLCGPVLHGSLMTRLFRSFGVEPSGCIGYSLGESAGLFALGAWNDWQEMFRRMRESDLFRSQLAGDFRAVRKSWNLSENDPFRWRACVVNRPRDAVEQAISHRPDVRLLIVNTPAQCVIGGREASVEAAVRDMDCESVPLDGVLSVHCDAAHPVRDAYRDLHRLPTAAPSGIRFYSCAWAESYRPSTEAAARSICDQAMDGFDFTRVVERAWKDGFRIFVEMGPHASCTGMIRSILAGRDHLAVSLCRRGEPERRTVLRALGVLAAHGREIDLGRIYGKPARKGQTPAAALSPADAVVVRVGGDPLAVPPPQGLGRRPAFSPQHRQAVAGTVGSGGSAAGGKGQSPHRNPAGQADREPLAALREAMREHASAHQAFLAFSSSLADGYRRAVKLQTDLSQRLQEGFSPDGRSGQPPIQKPFAEARPTSTPAVAFTREQCMAFAVGSVAEVLGDDFAAVDTYPVRVRLPDEPLMLVDRILSVEGRPLSLKSGRVVTEHDVHADAWYLDGGRAPVCISVEAGQADLFLCAYLGIDHAVKGKRAYRLLDAAIRFHRGLPSPGETLRYEIEIEKFMRQGDTYLFFFHFEGFADDEHLITMRDGCAGFFTAEEVRRSGGILFTENDRKPEAGRVPDGFRPSVPMQRERYDAAVLQALRKGALEEAFGGAFAGVVLPEAQRLPGGRMKLIDRIQVLDPAGGRFGIGRVCAEADIHPDDWFLTCHFVDDMTMPGTLMYECCAHTLRVFLQRMGWVSGRSEVHYEPKPGVEARLKCRGPVTPETHRVLYDVEIKEIGFDPEPFVIADAVMSADGRRIVFFENMSLQLSGTDRERLNAYWSGRTAAGTADEEMEAAAAVFDRAHILAFARGNPSEAFGAPYAPFDGDRVIARLPAPPYSFIDRVVRVEPEPWDLRPGGWITAEYDVPPDAWYFRADGSGVMPFAVLLEVALQPCGWLAAYLGSALRSDQDLKFRNLGGTGVMHRQVTPRESTLATRCRLTKVSEAGEMIIEHFEFDVSQGNDTIYTGNTYFGFFTREALSRQVGLRDAGEGFAAWDGRELPEGEILEDHAPLTPEDSARRPMGGLVVPARAIRMIDRIESWVPEGGARGLGFARGSKKVDPEEWFFSAHFHQDPVCPGSLGIESFLQLIRYAAGRLWRGRVATHRAEPLTGEAHEWQYRGQIAPTNRRVEVEAAITEAVDSPAPVIRAEGRLLVDGLAIYAMKNFGLRLVPIENRPGAK